MKLSIEKNNSKCYLIIDGFKTYQIKDDSRLEFVKNPTLEDIELVTIPNGQKDWFGNDIRETMYILK